MVVQCYFYHFIVEGGTVLVPPLIMVQTHAPNKKICQFFYDCNGAAVLAAPFTLAMMYCLAFLVCTVLAHFSMRSPLN
jgi:hypothetical protein